MKTLTRKTSHDKVSQPYVKSTQTGKKSLLNEHHVKKPTFFFSFAWKRNFLLSLRNVHSEHMSTFSSLLFRVYFSSDVIFTNLLLKKKRWFYHYHRKDNHSISRLNILTLIGTLKAAISVRMKDRWCCYSAVIPKTQNQFKDFLFIVFI